MAATTVSQASLAASWSSAAAPAWASVDSPASRRPSRSPAYSDSSAITACSGSCWRHSASKACSWRPAASTVAR
ncbi:hypothetical protein G6F60_015688 [Rhizopus arrhizus]|nr:hypothetical protein G6F23_015840 [Rhizopus arrhizus]KAG1369364.1 hypothetical protein G6F60_015688 [Rhizopus arrhizus]